MTLSSVQKSYTEKNDSKLFFALAEQLKLPFLQIARLAELKASSSETSLADIQAIADNYLELIDSFILNSKLQNANYGYDNIPVSLSASLTETAHQLKQLADKSDCDLELHIAGKYGPVMANPAALQAALINLGKVFLSAQSEREHSVRPVLKLAAHKTRSGITAGLFSDIDGLNPDMLKRARKMYGKARQPLSQFSANNGVGLFIADSLLKNMSSGLRIARHQKLSGLAATFTPSMQLELV